MCVGAIKWEILKKVIMHVVKRISGGFDLKIEIKIFSRMY